MGAIAMTNTGWRGRIGIVTPDDGTNDDEYWRFLPHAVNLFFTRYRVKQSGTPISVEMVKDYGSDDAIQRAAETLKMTYPDVVGYACNSCSFVHGTGADRRQADVISAVAAVPATTISSAMVAALRVMGCRHVSVVAPYSQDVTEKLRAFMVGSGIEVDAVRSAGLETEQRIGAMSPGDWYRFAKDTVSASSDALYVACSGIRTFDMIPHLEEDLGVPVVTSVQALLWHCCRLMKVSSRQVAAGRLHTEYGNAKLT